MANPKRRRVLADLSKTESKLEMTPMIDVTFLLLIFFMCTLKFKTLEGKLTAYLPKDVGVNQMDAEPKEKIEIRLDVRQQGNRVKPNGQPYTAQDEADRLRYVFDDTRVIQYSVGAKKTTDLAEVERTLKTFYAQDKERPATIDPRADVIMSDVVDVLDVALSIGFTDITFVGSYEK